MKLRPPKSRNDPCPCGSGKRYKHCHGGDAPPRETLTVPASTQPDDLARAALRNGRPDEAVRILVDAFGRSPEDLGTLKLLAEALRGSDPARSRACWERAHERAPDDPETLFFLGDFAREAGDFEEAIRRFEQALAVAPDHPALLNNLGLALEKAGRLDEAEPRFRRALEVAPDDLNALANLAQNLYQLHRFREAAGLFDRLIARMPTAPASIWVNRAICLIDCSEISKAAASFERAVELAPDSANAWRGLGIVRIEQRQFGAAVIALERAMKLDLEDVAAECMLFHANGFECHWRDFDAARARLIEFARNPSPTQVGAVLPFVLQSIDDDPELELRVARRWADTQLVPPSPVRPPRRRPDGRLNLGFVSSDLYEHPVGRLVVGLFERLDRSRYRVYAYSHGPDRADATRARLVAASDGFRVRPSMDAFEIAQWMRDDGVDVAFDLTGFTGTTVVEVLLHRPAPVQVNFLGYTGTMGSSAIDWILTDRFCVPPEFAKHYAERALYVDPCYMPSDTARTFSETPVTRREYGLPEDAVVFSAQMGAYKMKPPVLAAWMRILAEVDGSVLWMRQQSIGLEARLGGLARAHGVDPGRLRYVPSQKVPVYLSRFQLADLFLDATPFGSHTTVNDALFAGLPVLAIAGRSFASRASASQVHAAGLSDLVVTDLDAYVKKAVALARDPAGLRAIGVRLREQRASLPLFDLDRYAREFEAAIEYAWANTPET